MTAKSRRSWLGTRPKVTVSVEDRECVYPSDMDTEQAARSKSGPRRTKKRRGPLRRVLLCLACVFLGILVWLASSFAVYMLRPSSMNFSEKSAEWVRTLPFGNWALMRSNTSTTAITRRRKADLNSLSCRVSASAKQRVEVQLRTHHTQSAWPAPIAPVFATPLAG
jgi:negative regulator of sigma E activity